MKDSRLHKAIHDIKKISMTSAEKQVMLGRILSKQGVPISTPQEDHQQSVKSPWTVFSFNLWIQQHRWITAVVVVAVVLLAGNSAVRASSDALPGDTLYSLKVNVVEPVRVALASTPVAKAEIRAELVQKRLQEVETLAARGSLTEAQERQIQQRIDMQKTELATNVSEVEKTAPEKAQDITTTVEASINTHERVLAVLATNRGQFRATKNREVTLDVRRSSPKDTGDKGEESVVAIARAPKVTSPVTAVPTMQSVSVMSAPVAPTPTAAPVMEISAPTQVKPSSSPVIVPSNPEYQKRKKRVRSLIQQVNSVIASSTATTTSSIQGTITEEAKATLIQAEQSLKDADKHDQRGEVDQSYSVLIDTERSTKEAALLLEAKDRLGKDVRQEVIQKSSEDRPEATQKRRGKKEGK